MDYELIKHSKDCKVERFGRYKLAWSGLCGDGNWIPDGARVGPIDSVCRSLGQNRYQWDPELKPWVFNCLGLKIELRVSTSKNIGIFPEQLSNWRFLESKNLNNLKILNLFAYTGIATLIAARAGAEVTHVDASKSVVKWASQNAELSGLSDKPIRWIVEDAMRFLKREIKRGNFYDGVILDPPPLGRFEGKSFVFTRDIAELLGLVLKVLKPDPKLFILNCYALNLKPQDLKKLLDENLWERGFFDLLEYGELKLDSRVPVSTYARY